MRLFTLQTLLSTGSVAGQACSLIGPAYPPPARFTGSTVIDSAGINFDKLIGSALSSGKTDFGPFDNTNTTFSIRIFSAHESKALYERHHEATGQLALRIKPRLNGASVYRAGSVTKALSIYTMLLKLGSVPWQDPITKYVPELLEQGTNSTIREVNWSEVTLGALASHLSGVTRDYALLDMSADPNSPLTKIGFPLLNETEKVNCGTFGLKPCTRAESFQLLLKRLPVAAPFQAPVYSNAAYGLLGLALERMTGESFQESFHSIIAEPLNLSRTYWQSPPNDSNIVIPGGDKLTTLWDYDLAQDRPAGNAYLSTDDLATIGQSILSSKLLPRSKTMAWLKPTSHTAEIHGSVGMPWEIVRLDLPASTSNGSKEVVQTRVSDIYTKAGGIGAYGSLLLLSPDHGIGAVVLAAGPAPGFPGVIPALAEMIIGTWISAAEETARSQASEAFAGRYGTDEAGHVISIGLKDGVPGLSVEWEVNGTQILPLLGASGLILQPVGLESADEVVFRGVVQTPAPPLGGKEAQYLRPCSTAWLTVDTLRYGGFPLDEFVFKIGGDGKVVALELPVLRSGPLRKVV